MQKTNENHWQILDSPAQCSELESRVREVAKRLQDVELLQQHYVYLAQQAEESVTNYSSNGFDLGHGYAGLCMLFGELDRLFPDESWDLIGRDMIVVMKNLISNSPVIPMSMWGGLSGVGLAVRSLSRGGTRYQGFLAQLDDVLLTNLPSMLERSIRHLNEGVRADDFDVIHGLSGIARYLLFDHEHPQKQQLLRGVLSYMVRLCGERVWNGKTLPAWFIQPDRMISPIDEQYFPKGHFNLGLSHGIPSVIALFALTLQQGVEVEGQREALRTTSDWVWQARSEDEEGIMWGSHLSYENWEGNAVHKSDWNREAWCYGTPGVAYALYLAGEALGDAEHTHRALNAFRSVFGRQEENWGVHAPTLCHGYAGLLQITHRLFVKSGDKSLVGPRDHLLGKVMEMYREEAMFGYYEISREREQSYDYPGLLEGAAGSALALLSLISPLEPEWDAAFLLR